MFFLNPSWLIPSPQPTAVVSWGTTTWVTSGNAAHLQARNSTCVRRFRSNSQPKQHFKQAKDNARGIVFSKNARWEQKECNIQSEVPKIAQSCSILDAPLLFTSCMLQVPLCRCTTIAVINHLDPPLKPTAPLHLIFCHATISQSKATCKVSIFMWAYKQKKNKMKMEIHCMKPPFRVRSPGFLAKLHGQSGLWLRRNLTCEYREPDCSLCSKGTWHCVWNSMILVSLLFNRDLSGVATCCTGPKSSILHH